MLKVSHKKRKPKKSKKNKTSCCPNPKQEYHSDWKDETGLCANCGKRLKFKTER